MVSLPPVHHSICTASALLHSHKPALLYEHWRRQQVSMVLCCAVVDHIPEVPLEKFAKLSSVVHKIFSKAGSIRPGVCAATGAS